MSTEASTGGAAASGEEAFAWNEGWRTQMAAGSTDSDKELKQLERYESPEQIWRKAREFESKLSSGGWQMKLAEDASDEDVTQWRKDNGLPAEAKDYAINMPEGREKPPEDDAFLKGFLESAHKNNYSQAQVDGALGTFYAQVDQQIQAQAESDATVAKETEDLLRKDWGGDYRANRSMAEAVLSRAPEDFRDKFMNGRTEEGQLFKTIPDAWKWLVQLEREINPAATVVPGQTGDLGKTIEAEINDLKSQMGSPNSKYNKGPESAGLQQRYRDLIDARDQMKAKAGG